MLQLPFEAGRFDGSSGSVRSAGAVSGLFGGRFQSLVLSFNDVKLHNLQTKIRLDV